MADLLAAIKMVITYIVGGTYTPSGGTAVTIAFADSWVGKFATCITGTPVILLVFCLGLSLFGIHILRSLQNR